MVKEEGGDHPGLGTRTGSTSTTARFCDIKTKTKLLIFDF